MMDARLARMRARDRRMNAALAVFAVALIATAVITVLYTDALYHLFWGAVAVALAAFFEVPPVSRMV